MGWVTATRVMGYHGTKRVQVLMMPMMMMQPGNHVPYDPAGGI
jgi:hypothetical protein